MIRDPKQGSILKEKCVAGRGSGPDSSVSGVLTGEQGPAAHEEVFAPQGTVW